MAGPFTSDQLTIYLQDHMAGATFGVALARRAAGANRGTEYGDFLDSLAEEIAEDRATLQDIMARFDVGSDRIKNVLAWSGEKVGRLKLNGHLTGYAPLSRVLELEGLLSGVRGKLALLHALSAVEPERDELDKAEIDRLIARVERQLEGLAKHHRRAAQEAFSPS